MWLNGVIQKAFETKTKVIGPGRSDEKQAKVLNRTVTYTESGIQYEADPRHAEIIVREMDFESCKEVATPGSEEEVVTAKSEEKLEQSRSAKYRSIVARANYLAHDRPEIQFATKECARKMSDPNEQDWQKLKRLARFLKGHPRTTLHYGLQNQRSEVTVHAHANWANDKVHRKSTSGGTVQIGNHLIKTCGKTPDCIILG